MAKAWNVEVLFEWIVKKTIWFYLPFYAIYRLSKELFGEIFSRGKK